MKPDRSLIYLSIDFEDFSHDNLRGLGISAEPRMRFDALHRSLDLIQDFATRTLTNPRMTFFCTGIVARKCPEVVARIAAMGHEVACHYHYHDDVRDDDLTTLDTRLREAKAALEDASGQAVRGFRAPRFSIDQDDRARYAVIERHFDYDSSMPVDTIAECVAATRALGLDHLRILPIGHHRVRRYLGPLKTGGTYVKLFSGAVGLDLLRRSIRNGIHPMLYLHPYEFVADRSFMLGWRDLRALPLVQRTIFLARQAQWHIVGNAGMTAKLERFFAEFEHGGRLCDLLDRETIPNDGARA